MSRSFAFMLSITLAFSVMAAPARASVKGNTYEVEVTKVISSDSPFEDRFFFCEDGSFLSLRGGLGSWSEQKFGGSSLWSCKFGADVVRSSCTGLQIDKTVFGFGQNVSGGYFMLMGKKVE